MGEKKSALFIILLLGGLVRFFLLPYFENYCLDCGRLEASYDLALSMATGHGFTFPHSLPGTGDGIYNFRGFDLRTGDWQNIFPHGSYLTNPSPLDLEREFQVMENIYRPPVLSDTPGYAVTLGLLWSVFPHSYLPVEVIQIVIDTFMIYLLYQIVLLVGVGEEKRNRQVALFAAGIYALHPSLIMLSGVASRDAFAGWGLITGTYFFLRALKAEGRQGVLFSLYSGIALGFFCWYRSTIYLLPFAFLAFVLITKEYRSLQNMGKSLLPFVMILLLFYLPFSFVYKKYMGSYNFSTAITGHSFWEGLGILKNPYGFELSDNAAAKRLKELGVTAEPYTPESGKALLDDAFSILKEHPEFYLKILTYRVYYTLISPLKMGLPPWLSLELYKEKGGTLSQYIAEHPVMFILKCFEKSAGFLFTLGGLAGWFLYRKRYPLLTLILFAYLYKVGIHIPVHTETRYILEAYAFLIILNAFTLFWLKEKWQSRKRKSNGAETV